MTPLHIAEAVASIGLPGATTDIVEIEDDASALIDLLDEQRILGLAVSGIESGAVTAADDVFSKIVTRHDVVMTQSMRIEIAAVGVSSLLADAQIDHRVLKGTALAHTAAHSPSERSFRDVDVLVPSTSIGGAVELLLEAGATRLQPELRPGYDERFAKSITMRLDGVEVDLHRLLCPGPFGVWMRPAELFLVGRSFVVGGSDLPTLDPTDHLIHACYHVALGQVDPVLANLRDIALLAGDPSNPSFDGQRFDETIQRWRGRAVVCRAVGLAQSRLDVELPSTLARYVHESVDAAELAAVEPYLTTDSRGRFAALAPSTLRALPLSDRPAYALAVGLPAGSDPVDRFKSLLKRRT